MGKIISIANQKGGTGKTTTAVNLSATLSEHNKQILLVDLDPQGNATSGVGINKNELTKSVYDVLLDKANPSEIIIESVCQRVDILPCNISLTGAEIELVGVMARETRLKKALDSVKANYDYIIIDSPPSLGLLTLNSFVASDSAIVPIQCEFYALEGVTQLINTFNLIRESLNPRLRIEGVLLTMADYRTNLTNEVIKEIQNFFKDKVYKTIIPRNVRLSEAPSHGKPITLYDTNSIGARTYRDLSKEVLIANHDFYKSSDTSDLSNIESEQGLSVEDRSVN